MSINDKNIWLYWENHVGSTMPSYIGLCHRTIYTAIKSARVHLLTRENITNWLPDFDKDLQIIHSKTNQPSLALKTDYIRVLLLEKYGGLWLDSDVIVCQDLGIHVLDLLKDKEFICISKKKGHVSNNFIASRPGGKIISEYRARMEKELSRFDSFHWTQIGSDLLTRVVSKHSSSVHFLDEKRIHPISFEVSGVFFQNSLLNKVNEIIRPDTLTVMIYNSLFENKLSKYAAFRNWSEEKILNEDILISAIFRTVLGTGYKHLPKLQETTDPYYNDIGLIIPTMDRIESLRDFLGSIHDHFPGMPIYIAVQGDHEKEQYEAFTNYPNIHLHFVPYDFGLSATRNFLVRKVKEKYVLLCDDDFVFTDKTDLRTSFNIMRNHPEIKVVGGMFLNYYYDENNTFVRKQYTSFCNIIMNGTDKSGADPLFVPVEYLNLEKHFVDPEVFFVLCDSVNNLSLMDKSIFYDHDLWWDEQFKIMGEHEDFYLRAKKLNAFKIAYTNALVTEHHRKTTPQFSIMRSRMEGQENLLKKWGFSNLIIAGKRIDRMFRGEFNRIPFSPGRMLKNQQTRMNELKEEIQQLYSSKSWKISKPLRIIFKFRKK